MINELYEIPYRAELCYTKNKGLILPEKVPYLGMGSSYYAALVFKYLGIPILPEMASEYSGYLLPGTKPKNAVLISQSGESSEILWCADLLNSFMCIVNEPESRLAKHPVASTVIRLFSGPEQFSSSKSYINTLITLYLGFGIDPWEAIAMIKKEMGEYEEFGNELGRMILHYIKKNKLRNIAILGNGPNIGTAYQASLIMGEITKIPVLGMASSQYDHGPKEASGKSFVIAINPPGVFYPRTGFLIETVRKAGAETFEISVKGLPEKYTPVVSIIPFYFAAILIAGKLKIPPGFILGNKITTFRK